MTKRLKALIDPALLALTALSYIFGMSIARYLGRADSPLNFWLGFGWIILLVLSMNFLTVYFRPPNEPILPKESLKERNFTRAAIFQVSMALLGGVGLISILFFQRGVSLIALIFAGIILLIAIAYALPPLRLITSGFGELTLATLFALLIPAFALTLQTGENHRLLNAFAFPLFALILASFLALEFPAYKEDLKYERGSLLLRLGWERAVHLHHLLLLTAFLLFSLMPFFNLPSALFRPTLYVAPFAFLQIYTLQKIAQGAPPSWKFLKILAYSVTNLTFYVLIVTFWMR